MRIRYKYLAPVAFVLLLAASTSAQSASAASSVPSAMLRGTGKVAVVVVGSAAKSVWVTTKFTAKHVAKPVLKTVFLQAAPKLAVFAMKKSPVVMKKLTPTAIKLALL